MSSCKLLGLGLMAFILSFLPVATIGIDPFAWQIVGSAGVTAMAFAIYRIVVDYVLDL